MDSPTVLRKPKALIAFLRSSSINETHICGPIRPLKRDSVYHIPSGKVNTIPMNRGHPGATESGNKNAGHKLYKLELFQSIAIFSQSVLNAFDEHSTVFSMSLSSWALETKQASKAEGAKYIPCSSILT
jgi:hypothetical protein